MLFNSPIFIFQFLPVALLLFFVLGRFSPLAARVWLILASLFFYGWWNPKYLALLCLSAVVNYYCGHLLQNYPSRGSIVSKRTILYIALAWNILLLAYFKYFMFIVANVNIVTGADLFVPYIALPLAISFFTFQKIAYIVDSYLGKVKESPSFLNYTLFVAFFPQLIAGPIVHYSDILPQFREAKIYRFNWTNFSEGACIFMLGLAKKVVLADEFGRYADAGFNGAAMGGELSLVAAWISVIGYTLQLYFDFSGYSDMAIGLARMTNIALPQNFNSPYKAQNIIDFWRRWHMTLSRFLREYIYIPLGGNRHGQIRRYGNLMATMLIGGLWHGAGWTFLLWGGLHGIYLCINHLWVGIFGARRPPAWRRFFYHALTFLAVMVAWVLFRANGVDTAVRIYQGMLGWHGALLPDQLLAVVPPLAHFFVGVPQVPYLGDSTVMGTFVGFALTFAGLCIVFWAPNLYEMSRRMKLVLVFLGFAFTLQKVVFASHISPFLYFQF